MQDARPTFDAVILGGGLAGLCLALQLRQQHPDLDVLVLERRQQAAPLATHKVGESTVEIGAHYLDEVLGLGEHLHRAQIRKFGFRFFFSDGRDRLDDCTEVGVRRPFTTPSYQLDRGVLENFLASELPQRGVALRIGAVVRSFELGREGASHTVEYEDTEGLHTLRCRWLLDASGRAGLIRRQRELTRPNGHDANAVWFRLDARLELDGWCEHNPGWRGQCDPPERWRSTNHLCGPGYWAWLIPLSSGAHSVGIVADARMHPLEGMRDFDRARAWLERRQPVLGEQLAGCADRLMDFRYLRGSSYGCSQMFSADRWALTGEAGFFLDPFYSPGTDFIAITNTYICALIGQDLAGKAIAPGVRLYQRLLFSFYENMLTLYRGQYPLFGDATVMPAKIAWDYTYYWGVLCQLFFQQRLTDAGLFAELGPLLAEAAELNVRMQAFFTQWHARSPGHNRAAMLDQGELAWFAELNRGLRDPLDGQGLRARLRDHVALLHAFAARLVEAAAADAGGAVRAEMPPVPMGRHVAWFAVA